MCIWSSIKTAYGIAFFHIKIPEKSWHVVGKRPRMKKALKVHSKEFPQLHPTYAKIAARPQVTKSAATVEVVQEQRG